MDMNEAQSKALERGLNDATALSQDEWRGVALAMMAQCQPWYEELERLRTAAEGLKAAVCDDNNAAMLLRDISHHNEGVEASGCYRFVLDKGRELGLWS